MTNFSKELEKVADVNFFSRFMLANDFQTLLEEFEKDDLFLKIISQKEEKILNDIISLLIRHLRAFLETAMEPEYANPLDVPAAYMLWLLSKLDNGLSRCFCSVVLGMQNIWWAKKVVNRIMDEKNAFNDNQTDDGVDSEETVDEISLPVKLNHGDVQGQVLSRNVQLDSVPDEDMEKKFFTEIGESGWGVSRDRSAVIVLKEFSTGVPNG